MQSNIQKGVGRSKKAGLVLVEVLIVLFIMLVLGAIVLTGFNSLNKEQALDKDALLLSSVLNDARFQTLSSIDASKYGVHLSANEIVAFKGNSYSSTDSDNVTYSLSRYTEITGMSLSGGGSDIIFERLTGKTLQPGTVTLSLKSDSAATAVITVESTGVVNTD